MMHHIGDPIIKLSGEAADKISFFIGLAVICVFIARAWKRSRRRQEPDSDHEAED